MTDVKETFCRLCLISVTDECFETIDDVIRNILDALLLKLKFNSKDVICNACRRKLNTALELKSMCCNTDNVIIPYADSKKMLQLDLRDVYMKERASEQVTDISQDQKVCRLCMQPVESEFRCILKEEFVAIQKFVPEMNINVVKDPVVCKPCFDSVCTHNSFLKEVEEKIRGICDNPTTEKEGGTHVSPSDLFIKTEHLDEGLDVNEMGISIKTECVEIKSEEAEERSELPLGSYDIETSEISDYKNAETRTLVLHMNKRGTKASRQGNFTSVWFAPSKVTYKCNECTYETESESRFTAHCTRHNSISEMHKCDTCKYETSNKKTLQRHRLRHQDPSQVQMYPCDLCDFTTKYKSCLKYHQLKHKNASEVQMYSCESCDYKTKHKRYLVHHALKHQDSSQLIMYKCKVCDYESRYKKNLTYHQLTHKDPSQVETYRCKDCNFETKHRSNIKHHLLTHIDRSHLPRYRCNECEYESTYKRNLTRHQLTHKE
ncbi:zinc finger protein 710-like [Anoplophora glabripennis]|uniref:zinc finger protein 710-like n=1 Tax=Anoplophora glabripennis TaxID=217634 RepID=UPI000873D718|nr:zinc finger protein 710-like [Anoplophora glabripennis]